MSILLAEGAALYSHFVKQFRSRYRFHQKALSLFGKGLSKESIDIGN